MEKVPSPARSTSTYLKPITQELLLEFFNVFKQYWHYILIYYTIFNLKLYIKPMTKAIYPWSFDPFTNWHEDVLKKSWERFSQVVVAVWQNPDKKYMFSFPERVEIIKWATKSSVYWWMNIDVKPFWWLLTDFTYEQWSKTVIRWIRWNWDIAWEEIIKNILEKDWITTVYFWARQDQTHVSSSVSKALLKEQWFIQDYVSLIAKHFMEARMNWQYIVWLTGTVWAWKSYITDRFIQLWLDQWIQVHNIDLDKIGHRILETAIEEWYQLVRQELVEVFWDTIKKEWWFIDRKKLWEIVFNDTEKRKVLDNIMFEPMQVRIRKEMYGKKWIILLNWALIIEAWITDISNNNVVLIWVNERTQQERLASRWLNLEQIERRVNSQFSTNRKKQALSKSISDEWYWNVVDLENNWKNETEIEDSFNKMLCGVDVFWELRIKSVFRMIWMEEKWLDIYAVLKPMYDGPERLYHNWFHIVSCLNMLYDIKNHISKDEFIALFFAILFHDAIYDSKAKKWENEWNSAIFAREFLSKIWVSDEIIAKVDNLISLTATHEFDWKHIIWAYMIDIDLSILWQPWDIYHWSMDSIKYGYMRAIRNEYANYSEQDYINWRLAFLRWKLSKSIFKTPYFINKYENQAKENMEREIVMLEKYQF